MISIIRSDGDIKALIFDCDGTLVNSMPLHMQAWREAFGRCGAEFEEEYVSSLRGMKETEIVRRYNQTFGTELDGEKVVQLKHDVFLKRLNEVKPVRPVVDVARFYSGKMPLAVVSGGVRMVVQRELRAVGIFDLFDVVLTADDPYRPKPEPDIFLAAAREMKVEPRFCLVFEDGDAGLDGAVRAGMKSIDVREYVD